ncbi:MAG: hypothetical protein CM15mP120_20370 [Pseudomonadota bacterium]|nr:MAG: hypothetical protein CM15mP120_20370 [Pseudomonadota bacterium]
MGYRWLNRHLGVTEDVVNLIYSDTICAIAQQLLGGTLRQVVQVATHGQSRPSLAGGPTDPLTVLMQHGVFIALPYGDKPREPDACHTDGHPFQLGVVGLMMTAHQMAARLRFGPVHIGDCIQPLRCVMTNRDCRITSTCPWPRASYIPRVSC